MVTRAITFGKIPVEPPKPKQKARAKPKPPLVHVKLDGDLRAALDAIQGKINATLSDALRAESERVLALAVYGNYFEYGSTGQPPPHPNCRSIMSVVE